MGKDRENQIINSALSIVGEENNFNHEMDYLFNEIEKKDDIQIDNDERTEIARRLLRSEKMLSFISQGHVRLTPFGLEILRKGGFLKYLDQLKYEEEIAKEKKTLEMEILRQTKEYNKYSVWAAGISAGCAITTIILTIVFSTRSDKDYSRLEEMIRQNEIIIQENRKMIQEYKDLMIARDTLIKTDIIHRE